MSRRGGRREGAPGTALLLVVSILAGCAGAPGIAPERSDRPPGPAPGDAGGTTAEGAFVRVVDPFPVTGPGGRVFADPFLGGFNQPRPQLVDVDGDGDLDLFVQEASNSVAFYEHTDDPIQAHRWRTDRFHDLDVGEWYRFVDMDQDGDPDLLAEQPFSYIRYYRNEGSPTEPRFVLAADSLRTVDGEPLFSDRQNIPNATDLDQDGAVDLLIGRLEGTVSHYEQSGTDAADVPVFRLVTDRFENIEIVGALQGGSLHGANTMALGDIDEDGDADLFWGDFFEEGLLFIENRGSPRRPILRTEPVPFPTTEPLLTSGYNAPTVGDADGDGDRDLLVGVLGGAFNPNTTTVDNFHLLEQGEGGVFTDRTARYIGTIDVGSESVPVPVDLDGDGLLDLLLGNKITQHDPQAGELHRYLNRGTATAPALVYDGVLEEVRGGYHFIPAFGDLDGDGDQDAVVGTWQDRLRLYRNDAAEGGLELTLVDSALVTLSRGRNAAPALGDLDGDGDLDLVVGESSGELNYYRNGGTPSEPSFILVNDAWLGADVGRRSFPVLEDLDGDGDLDLLVGSEGDGVLLWRNQGTPTAPRFVREEGGPGLPNFGYAAPAFADLDGDGDRDVLLGGTGGGLWYLERR